MEEPAAKSASRGRSASGYTPPVTPPSAASLAAVPFAHPVSADPHVDLPIALIAAALAVAVIAMAMILPARTTPGEGRVAATMSWHGSLSWPQTISRVVAVVVLATGIVAGRIGADDELENLAPALVVGAGLPLLFLAALILGPVWRWVDPWDAAARMLVREDGEASPGHVWPAVGLALPLVWFLSVYPLPLDPRSVGTALALYTVLTLAGCVAFGRVRWLASAEPVGILLSWVGLAPRRRLSGWNPPRGAEALLGVAVGGVLFGAVRRTEAWSGFAVLPQATLYATGGLLLTCVAVAAFLLLAAHADRVPARGGGVANAVVPVVAGVVVAVGLARNRLSNSVQLLPGLAGDPLGRGWDLLGDPTDGLHPDPLGAVGLLVLQLAVVAVVHLLGAVVVARRTRGMARLPAALALAGVAAASVTAVSLH